MGIASQETSLEGHHVAIIEMIVDAITQRFIEGFLRCIKAAWFIIEIHRYSRGCWSFMSPYDFNLCHCAGHLSGGFFELL